MHSQFIFLACGDASGFAEQFFVYADFADVVEEAGKINFMDLLLVEVFVFGKLFGNPLGDEGDSFGMAACVAVFGVDASGQCLEGADE
jgi:hypothetical protein